MAILRKSVKVIMSKEDILKLRPKRGIDLLFEPIKTNSNIYIVTISGTNLNPSNPSEEVEESDLDELIADQLHVYSDRIREPKDLAKIPKVARQMAMSIDDIRLNENKYDFIRSKSKDKPATPLTPDPTFVTIDEG